MTYDGVYMSPRFVKSADGTRLAVFESGPAGGPVLVAVHGYPDNHTVWDGIAAELGDVYRVVRYDARGAGESDKPAAKSDYLMDRLVEDLTAVIDEVSPDAPVHLLGHDWGSIQSWAAVTDPALADRIASYTSISGPHLDYVGAWMRDRRHPVASLRQALHSWYIAAFQIPRLPERLVVTDFMDRAVERAEQKGTATGELRHPMVRSEADKVNGINLYRANMPSRLLRPHPVPTGIPVQVLAPSGDAYVTPRLALETAAPYAERLTSREIPGTHWVVSEHPEMVAAHVRAHLVAHPAPAPAKRAAKGRAKSSAKSGAKSGARR